MWPLLALALGLQGGGALLSGMADNKVQNAQEGFRHAEDVRQEKFREQSREAYNKFADTQNLAGQNDQTNKDTQALTKVYENAVPASRFSEMLPGQGNASDVVHTDIVNNGMRGVSDALQQARAKAKLQGFSSLNLDNAIGLNRTKQGIGQIGVSADNSLNILPSELKGAESKGGGLRTLAGLLKGAGSIASMASGSMAGGTGGGLSDLFKFGGQGVDPSSIIWKTTASGAPNPLYTQQFGYGVGAM